MDVVPFADAEFRPIELPGGSGPIEAALLHRDEATGARTLLVRFPLGWERPGTIRCDAAEEFVVLDGSIEINGAAVAPSTWVHIPAGAPRRDTRTPAGLLALARFDGSPRWHEE